MMMKRTHIVALTALTLVLAVPTAYAAATGAGAPPARTAKQGADGNWQYPGLSPEKRAVVYKIMEEEWRKTLPLRNDLWAKGVELRALTQNDKTDPDRLTKIISEMKDLRAQLVNIRLETGARLEKEAGITDWAPGMSMHRDRLSDCDGRGYDGPSRGWGGGACGGYGCGGPRGGAWSDNSWHGRHGGHDWGMYH